MFLLHYMIWGLPTAMLETRRQSARVWCEPLAVGWWLVAALELGQTLADAAGHGSSAGIDRVLRAEMRSSPTMVPYIGHFRVRALKLFFSFLLSRVFCFFTGAFY